MVRAPVSTILRASVVTALLTIGVAGLAAGRNLDLAPKVGDIAVFGAKRHFEADWKIDATEVADGTSCVLQPDVMMRNGGSLVVEERTAKASVYRVHWAGPRTASGKEDCGTVADLTLAREDLQMLINAAGGPGVEPKRFPELW
jgi:hypothetical protein